MRVSTKPNPQKGAIDLALYKKAVTKRKVKVRKWQERRESPGSEGQR